MEYVCYAMMYCSTLFSMSPFFNLADHLFYPSIHSELPILYITLVWRSLDDSVIERNICYIISSLEMLFFPLYSGAVVE